MSRRPVIGVTGPVRGGLPAWIMTALALLRAGARPVRVTALAPVEPERLDGLVIGGGSDIAPENYGEELLQPEDGDDTPSLRDRFWSFVLFLLRLLFSAKRRAERFDAARDALETRLCRHALETGMPVLGICRGAQLINTALGGTLHQEIAEFYTETPAYRGVLPGKTARLAPESRLRTILDTDSIRVNALHHQAVKKLGTDLRIAATEATTVVQGIEHVRHPFLIGVQWHPEYLPQVPRQQRLFRALVAATRAR